VYDLVEDNDKNTMCTDESFNLEWPMLPSSENDGGTESDCAELDSIIVELLSSFDCIKQIGGIKPNYKSDGYEPVEIEFDESEWR
jgi:hypothetical protein